MVALNPGSVNTIRILSLLEQDTVKIIAATLRTGNSNCVVDNLKHGGIGANVNIETGIVDSLGKNYAGNIYRTHPATGHPFCGFQIPFWNEALCMIHNLHPQLSQCPILGWDIAITEDKPVLVEINNGPGPMIHQFINKVPCGEVVLRFIKERI
jgi:hypothetical protein